MEYKILKSVKFPGLEDVYVIPQNIQTLGILPANNWNNNEQSITVVGVTKDNPVFVSPNEESYYSYSENGIRCIAQDTNTLTFACDITPEVNIAVNIVILA